METTSNPSPGQGQLTDIIGLRLSGIFPKDKEPSIHGDRAMNPAPVTTVATEINRLHEEAKRCACASRQALQGALVAAWQAGQLLVGERKRVFHTMGPGAWLLWLEANFRGTARTAQRYMRLAQCVADIAFLQGMSLRQAYARLGIATEPKTPAKRPLSHKLPAHLVLASKLIRALKRPAGKTAEEQGEAYRTRHLRAHLGQLGLQISSLDFRRFCKRHSIRRDERAGRPRIHTAARAAG